jgi:tyrosinase
MPNVTRRTFIATASAIPFALWAEKYGYASMAPLVRYDARSANGIAMLKIYASAVKTMQALNTGNPQSWNFQWYTHCVQGSSSSSQQAPQKAAAIAAAYPPGTPAQKAIALAAWGTCQAHYSGLEDYFLPWHRMYVYFLEAVVRKVTKEPTFTLPYWDYSVAGANHGVLPPQFRMPNDPLFKYLYVGKRNTSPAVNAGAAIDQFDPGALDLTALNLCNYSNVGSVTGFCQTLDFGLHGNVHVDTGAGQNMGAVPWAAGDPIFWMHHSNIDRLWASWNKGGRTNPTTPAFLAKSFTFADGNGNSVVVKIQDVLNIAAMNYTYDRFEPVTPCRIRPRLTFTKLAQARVALGPTPVRVQMKSVPSTTATSAKLRARLPRLTESERIYLVLKHLETNDLPGVLYHVYLGLPDGTDPKAGAQYKVGVINFFHAAGHAMNANDDSPAYSFDVTDLLKALGTKNALTDEPVVTITPLGRPSTEAKPIVGEASLVQQ